MRAYNLGFATPFILNVTGVVAVAFSAGPERFLPSLIELGPPRSVLVAFVVVTFKTTEDVGPWSPRILCSRAFNGVDHVPWNVARRDRITILFCPVPLHV